MPTKDKECAFCGSSEKLSAEHIFGSWITDLFSKSWESQYTDKKYRVSTWKSSILDMTAKVVCERCNNTWMSDIENLHAKPTMTPLIRGDIHIPIRQPEARSLSLYAFKTAVVADHMQRQREPFFSRRIRQAFYKGLDIPQTVQMWLCAFAPPRPTVNLEFGYYTRSLPSSYPLEQLVVTCGIGNFAFQVIALKQMRSVGFDPLPGFEDLAVPFWPRLMRGFIWPAARGLRSIREFKEFHRRWDAVAPRL